MAYDQIRVQSDGNPRDTVITTANGEELKGVSSVTVHMDGTGMPYADLTIWMPTVDVHVYPADIDFECPVCQDTLTHTCPGDTTRLAGPNA